MQILRMFTFLLKPNQVYLRRYWYEYTICISLYVFGLLSLASQLLGVVMGAYWGASSKRWIVCLHACMNACLSDDSHHAFFKGSVQLGQFDHLSRPSVFVIIFLIPVVDAQCTSIAPHRLALGVHFIMKNFFWLPYVYVSYQYHQLY